MTIEPTTAKATKILSTVGALALGCSLLVASPARASDATATDALAAVAEAERALGLIDDSIADESEILEPGTAVPILDEAPGFEIVPGTAADQAGESVVYTADQLSADEVRFAAVIDATDAPDATWDFGEDIELIALDDGRVSVSDHDGNLIAGIDAPWAVDAAGRSLPTNYRVDGSLLIQEVRTGGDTEFPVVADPKWTAFPGYWTVTLNRSESATAVGTVAGCAALFAKSPVPVLRALTITCGVLAAFSTAQLAGGKCVKLHLAGVPGVIAQWWPTFPKC